MVKKKNKKILNYSFKKEKIQNVIIIIFRIFCIWIIIRALYEGSKIEDNDDRIIFAISILLILAILELIIVNKKKRILFRSSKNVIVILIIIFMGIVYVNRDKFIIPLNLIKITEDELDSIN